MIPYDARRVIVEWAKQADEAASSNDPTRLEMLSDWSFGAARALLASFHSEHPEILQAAEGAEILYSLIDEHLSELRNQELKTGW